MTSDRQFKQLFFLIFAPFALSVTYLNLYYQRRGLSHGEIGTLGAVASATSIASPLLWGYLSDRARDKRRVVLGLALGMALLFPLQWCTGAMLWLALLAAGVALCRAPLPPLADALCLETLHARGDPGGDHYARLRLWGSVGFVAVATGFPLLLRDGGEAEALARLGPVFGGFGLLSLLLVLRLATLPSPPTEEQRDEGPPGSALSVLAVPGLKSLLAVLVASQVSNAAYYVFLSLYLDDIGVPDQAKGLYWAVGVIGEVLLMAIGPAWVRRYGVRNLILLGIAGRVVRLAAYGCRMPPLVALLLVQPLHALAFGAVHIGTIGYLARTVPERLRATGQTLFSSLTAGLGGVLGSLLAGWLSEAASAGALSRWTSATGLYASFQVAACLQAVVLWIGWRVVLEPERPGAAPMGTGPTTPT